MSKHRWGFFPFSAVDYKAAQAYLDRKAASGWVLDKLYLGRWARFVPAQGRYHCVDLDTAGGVVFDDGPDPEYLQLCEDAGWELVVQTGGMLLFRSRPGEHPAPIQSDPNMEGERFWKKYIRRQLLSLIAVFLFLALMVGLVLFALPTGRGIQTSFLFLTAYGPLFLLSCAADIVLLVWHAGALIAAHRRWRAAGALSARYKSAWIRGVLSAVLALLWFAVWGLSVAERAGLGKSVDLLTNPFSQEDTASWELCESCPVLLSADYGLDRSGSYSRSLEGRRAPLADSLCYEEFYDAGPEDTRGFFLTERYDCTWEWTARALLSARRSDTERGGTYLYGDIPWTPAPGLGFDESWTAWEGHSALLFRQGKVVGLVTAPGFDLTAPENLALVREKLRLDP